MTMTRRTLLAGMAGGTASLIGGTPALAQEARREFAVIRGESDIGRHSIALSRQGSEVIVDIDVEIVVRVLGIAAYRYQMTNRERWRDGLLIEGDSQVNDDGTRKRVISRRENGTLLVESPDFEGAAPDRLATTTYFTTDFLDRGSWLSTDSGALFDVNISRVGPAEVDTPQGRVSATRWRVTNGEEFHINLDYDERGEWLSVRFDAQGTVARYRPLVLDPAFGPIWRGA
jgi:hypothetical protein